jgi:hypothetical protein
VAIARKRSKKPVDDAAVEAGSERYVAALAGHRAPWATSAQLGFPSKDRISAAVVKRLLAEKRVLAVGKMKGAEAYTLLGAETARERLSSLAERALAEQLKSDKLDLLPLSADAKRYAPIPRRVRDHIAVALQQSVLRKEAFAVNVGGSKCVALLANLQALVAAQGASQPRSAEPPTDVAAHLDPRSVLRAYEQLSQERRSPNIVVSELQRESGVELEALQRWLISECLAHRAVPLLGEPAHATPEQLAAALVVEGRPHLYVRLVQEQQA